jgi:hypothetical protein
MKTIKEIMNGNTRIDKPTTNFVIVCHRKLSMSEHRMDGLRSPAKAKDFPSSLCAQTRSETHSAFNPMSNGVLSRGLKRGRGVTLTSHPHLMPISRMSMSYASSPLIACMTCSETALLCSTVHHNYILLQAVEQVRTTNKDIGLCKYVERFLFPSKTTHAVTNYILKSTQLHFDIEDSYTV